MTTTVSSHFADRFAALFNESDLRIADEIFDPAFTAQLPGAPLLDRDGWKGYAGQFLTGFPDLQMELHDLVTTDDRIVLRVTYRGTHLGEFQGVPPTGKPITLTAIGMFDMADGRVMKNWAEMDVLGLMQQIGAVPTPG